MRGVYANWGIMVGMELTGRELEISKLMTSEGLSALEISERLGLTVLTVRSYIKNLYSALGVHNQTALRKFMGVKEGGVSWRGHGRAAFLVECIAVRNRAEGCWEWPYRRHRSGYAWVTFNGQRQVIHRLAHELATETKIPKGLCACHVCDNPSCFNPSHIFIGTQRDNIADSIAKGRFRRWRRYTQLWSGVP